ncbi:sialin [Trichonephila inaurata madagascariensis]|uniref:Sialin n=1 Tax=Trichonephila inaurata madagascariensis TaxID=2747483 RepID=A0A8X6YJG4_9ARAC|nr:sialin [Trichonephila inaurata madagascariensis]
MLMGRLIHFIVLVIFIVCTLKDFGTVCEFGEYKQGTIGSLWVILWAILAYETPDQHPGISKEELLYIQKNQSEKSEMGVIYPSITFAVSRWAPKFERSRIFALINLGTPLGNIIGALVSGSLYSSDLFGGWPSTFYVLGTIGSLWVILWAILAYETPDQHPGISKEELLYIQKNQSEKSEMVTGREMGRLHIILSSQLAYNCGG